jgi:hypothetical protein
MADKVNDMPEKELEKVGTKSEKKEKTADVAPMSLRELYEMKRPNPQKFLSSVDKIGSNPFELTDQDAALAIQMTADSDLIVTTNLLYRSQLFRSGKYSYSCANFVERIIRREAKIHGSPLPEDNLPGVETYAALCSLASTKFKQEDRKKWALNLIAIGAMWLRARNRLSFDEAFRPIERLVIQKKPKSKTLLQTEETAFEILTKPPINVASIKKLCQFSEVWETERKQALDDARSANAALQIARSEIEAIKSRVTELENEVQSRKDENSRQIASYEDRLKQHHGERINVQHDLGGVRSRLLSSLNNKIRNPINIALEAIEVEPPRIGVVEQELNTALDSIERELKWLMSSD